MIPSCRFWMTLLVITKFLNYYNSDAFHVTSSIVSPNRERRILIQPVVIETLAFQQRRSRSIVWGTSKLRLSTNNNENDEEPDPDPDPEEEQKQQSSSSNGNKKKRSNKKKKLNFDEDNDKGISKEDIVKAVGETFRSQQQQQPQKDSILDKINPFKAGQNLRKTIDQTLTQISSPVDPTQSKYYLDDRFLEPTAGGAAVRSNRLSSSTSDVKSLWEQEEYIPEVLVVGATGEVGRLVVRRLLRSGRCRVRVLVRDLYTKTLNMLGPGVTYCQGDLNNIDSLQYAVTDVDKIIFVAIPPRPDEEQFREKFQDYIKEILPTTDIDATGQDLSKIATSAATANTEWEQLESVLEVRAKLAEQVDYIGMQNLIRAYQDVRHADYGTSQAAKRSLFKFEKDRPDDFYLFSLSTDDDDDDNDADTTNSGALEEIPSVMSSEINTKSLADHYDNENDDVDEYNDNNYDDDEYDDYEQYAASIENRRGGTNVKTQTQWIRNKFDHGVFVGRIPTSSSTTGNTVPTSSSGGGEASIISTRLRARDDPDNGIDLGGGGGSSSTYSPFAGFIIRVCGDGGTYEAFVRTGSYTDQNIEYVCEFSTATKSSATTTSSGSNNKSRNKFITVRLPFENFKPVRRQSGNNNNNNNNDESSIPPFRGRDVRNIGFRYRAGRNAEKTKIENQLLVARGKRIKDEGWARFYLALCYIKLYRSQPEPEIVYLSDARIPRIVRNGMVRHDSRRLVSSSTADDSTGNVILDDATLQQARTTTKAMTDSKVKVVGRSPEEIYYKYRGEEILKNSGLSYAILRVTGFNELPTSETSTIDITASQPPVDLLYTTNNNNEDDVVPTYVSRDEVAQVCVSAILDPNALNKSFYVTKKPSNTKPTKIIEDDDLATKFASLPADVIA